MSPLFALIPTVISSAVREAECACIQKAAPSIRNLRDVCVVRMTLSSGDQQLSPAIHVSWQVAFCFNEFPWGQKLKSNVSQNLWSTRGNVSFCFFSVIAYFSSFYLKKHAKAVRRVLEKVQRYTTCLLWGFWGKLCTFKDVRRAKTAKK